MLEMLLLGQLFVLYYLMHLLTRIISQTGAANTQNNNTLPGSGLGVGTRNQGWNSLSYI